MRVIVPATVAEARAMGRDGAVYAAGLTATPIASGRASKPDALADLSRLRELSGVALDGDMVRIGAMTSLEAIRTSSLVAAHAPALTALLASVASLQVRRLATIGGNIAWGAGDLVPALLAQRALVARDGQRAPIAEASERELIEAVLIPTRAPDWTYAEKVGFREAFSPSVVTVAGSAQVVDGRLASPVLAIGGGATPPQRLARAESYLDGRRLSEIDPGALRRTIRSEARCGDGAGLSASHRGRVAANLLVAALMDTTAWNA